MLAPLALRLIARAWRHHPWRYAAALAAVALGVALAWSVHLINGSALAEFASAVRSTSGTPDLVLRGQPGGFDERLFERAAADADVAQASPVVEIETAARSDDDAALPLRLIGIDALRVATLAPALRPLPSAGESPLAALDPQRVFVNASLRAQLARATAAPARQTAAGTAPTPPSHAGALPTLPTLQIRAGERWQPLRVAGDVAAGGTPLVVMDIAGAQTLFGMEGRLTRIDLRLAPGTDHAALLARLALPADVRAASGDEGEQRASSPSRAYRVNLTVLALVALFVGAFLVYSVVSLAIAQRTPAFALLGVLGLTAGERRALVLAECALLGLLGSTLGLALGTAMALAALRWLGGDLGGGFFRGLAPTLHASVSGALVFALLGTASALVGGWWPARAAQALVPAQALKGLGSGVARPAPAWPALALLVLGVLLAFAPPVAGLPIAAYLAVAALPSGGVALIPALVELVLARLPRPRHALALLAWRRARWQRATATAAVAGVVSGLALCVALTVMVTSFRDGVAHWLDAVLPADIYARSTASAAAAEAAWLPADLLARAAALPGVARVRATRVRALQLAPGRPAVTLLARPLGDAAASLPLRAPPLPPRTGRPGVFVSEAVASLYGVAPGTTMRLPLPVRHAPTPGAAPATDDTFVEADVRGIWRDYARQFGAIAIDLADYRALTGDDRVNELALWLAPGTEPEPVLGALRALGDGGPLLEFATTRELRAASLRIFDRSFAVTYYLQVVAIAIGLVGIGASLSTQVLARRKEFGLLAHLGLTSRQVLALVCGEAAAWLAVGTLLGVALGIAVAVVLVYVVNPQSFHWTMELVLPPTRLGALAGAVLAAGVATSALAARGAVARRAVLSVKEDW
ncbi:MAG TPA: ABC transporter permease [Rubrivivax sp.]|nr:ABC transporter permease [Rubrivivax sp.]